MSRHSGYFAIADISGYTGYLASTELEHARGILSEITDLLIREMRAPFRFIELEGDAVFVFAPSEAVLDAERLVDIVEICYASFRLLRQQMVSNTSCTCAACRAIGDLDLKCVVHYGEYAPQQTPTGTKLLGPDVILIHRLLKNQIIEKTNIKAYAFLTKAVTDRLAVAKIADNTPAHSETYDGLGTVEGSVLDLERATSRHIGTKRIYVSPDDSDATIVADIAASKSVLWQYFIDASRRLAWQKDTVSVDNQPGENGRVGIGAASYCDHGSYRLNHRYVDWRPFDYMTSDSTAVGRSPAAPPPSLVTFEFTEIEPELTRVDMRIRVHNRAWWMRALVSVIRPLIVKTWRTHFKVLESVVDEENARLAEVINQTANV